MHQYIFVFYRIQVDSSVQSVDPHIPNMDFNKFVRYFITDDTESQPDPEGAAIGSEVTDDFNGTADPSVSLQVVDEEKVLDGGSLTSADSGIIDTVSKGRINPFVTLSFWRVCFHF